MEIKILQVFLGADGLPYKDQQRTVHFPIIGSGFQGASNTTKIRFYYDELVEEDDTETAWVACAKLPNGKIGSKVLETDYDSTLGEHYALLELDSFYFQYKGDVYISLQGYQGGVQVDYDEETELYTIYGTPTIAATGSIKLSVNYATQFIGSGETSNVNFQRILADLGTKLGIRATSVFVEELPTVGNTDTFYVIHNDLNDPNKANIYIWNDVTEHYIWVGDNTLDLGEYYTQEEGTEFEGDVLERLNQQDEQIASLGQLRPSGVDTSTNILAFNEDKGIYIGSDTGNWYYWNGSQYVSGGSYVANPYSKGYGIDITTNVISVDTEQIPNKSKTLLRATDGYSTCQKRLELSGLKANVSGQSIAKLNKLYGFTGIYNQRYTKTFKAFPFTDAGLNYSLNADGSIHIQGTATGTSTQFFVYPFDFQANHYYYLAGCPQGGSTSTYFCSWSLAGNDVGSGKVSKAASAVSNGYAYIRIMSGTQVNLDFKPVFIDLTDLFGAGYEPITPAAAISRGISKEIMPYDTGTTTNATIDTIESWHNGKLIDKIELPNDLLTYLSDKGYGQSNGYVRNYIDFENKKYYQFGYYSGSTWTSSVNEYDISSYFNEEDTYLNVKDGGEIVFKSSDNQTMTVFEIGYIEKTEKLIGKAEISGFNNYMIDAGTMSWNGVWNAATSDAYSHLVIPVLGERTIIELTTASTPYGVSIMGVTKYEKPVTNQQVTNMGTRWNKNYNIDGSNETRKIIIPKDVKYVIINYIYNNTVLLSSLKVTQITKIKAKGFANSLKLEMAAFNVRDFGDGTTDGGCPSASVSTNLPLWKDLISKKLNKDFMSICEWRNYFDEDDTIDAYETLFKQFYPYKFGLPTNDPVQMLLSKYECLFLDLHSFIDVNRTINVLVTNINGFDVAVVCWLQSAQDAVENRVKAYNNAISYLQDFDIVILGGDFNTEVGLDELQAFNDAGYTLGNGGYWGEIKTWNAMTTPTTPNDNIVTKGVIYELFEALDTHLTSDHLPVIAKFSKTN